MAKSMGEALKNGEPVIFTFKDRVPELYMVPGKEKEALDLLVAKGLIKILDVETRPYGWRGRERLTVDDDNPQPGYGEKGYKEEIER